MGIIVCLGDEGALMPCYDASTFGRSEPFDLKLTIRSAARPNPDMPHQPQRGQYRGARDVADDVVVLQQSLRIDGDDESRHQRGDGRAD